MFNRLNPVRIIISLLVGVFIGLGFLSFSYPIKYFSLYTIIFFALIGSFLSYTVLFVKSVRNPFIGLTRAAKGTSYLFLLLLSLILTMALKGPQQHLAQYSFFVIVLTYLATFLFFSFGILFIIRLFFLIHSNDHNKEIPKRTILYFASLPIIISLFYFWAYYPGVLMADSVNQWQQAHSTFYNDWHPVMMTWLIKLTTLLWDNPACFVILQFILAGLITGYVLYSFKKLNINKWILLIGYLFLSGFPLISLYSVVIWKDTLFGYFFLLFTTILLQILYTNGKWLHSYKHLFCLYLALCGVALFRHNGWPVILATIIIFLFFLRKNYWRLYGVFFLVIGTYLIITGPVYQHFKVFPAEPTESYSIPFQQIARVMKEDGDMTTEQKQFFHQVLPINEWKQRYHPTDVDMIKFTGHFNREFIKANKKEFFTNWLAVSAQNPKLAFAAFSDQVQLAWKLYVSGGDMRRPIFRDKAFSSYRPVYFMTSKNVKKYHVQYKWFHYKDYGSDKANMKLYHFIKNINQSITHGLLRVFVMPALYLYLIVLFLFITTLKGNWRYLLAAVPMLLNLGSMFAAIPAQDIRYFYPNYLLAVPFFFLATLSWRKRDGNG